MAGHEIARLDVVDDSPDEVRVDCVDANGTTVGTIWIELREEVLVRIERGDESKYGPIVVSAP